MSKLKSSRTLAGILDDTRSEIAHDKAREPLIDLKRKLSAAPKARSFISALRQPGLGLIAEIKECSPSKGPMLPENVRRAAGAYKDSKYVRAISVLTSRTNFGETMTVDHLLNVKRQTGKPVLRKDFIIDEYQIYQARAYGADAILLMANILKQRQLHDFYNVATRLGLDVLFETHEPAELRKIPAEATIYGINSRNFCSESFVKSRLLGCFRVFGFGRTDLTTDFVRFSYCSQLPSAAVKVAESGISPDDCRELAEAGFNAILVGTSLLLGPEPLEAALARFERQLEQLASPAQVPAPTVSIPTVHAHA